MRKIRAAIVGFGKLGRACALALRQEEQVDLVGVVRRPERTAHPLPKPFAAVPVASHVADLDRVDVALVCVPTERVHETARELLQRRIAVVECATLHEAAFESHKVELDRLCQRFKVPAVVGAGWDPGALSLIRALFSTLVPKGHTEVNHNPGLTLHHTVLMGDLPGVSDMLTTQVRAADGHVQHYIYVELKPGADDTSLTDRLRNDPLFAGEEIMVFPVDSLSDLLAQNHGLVMQRIGTGGGIPHQAMLFEARFSDLALAAQVMLAAARAIPGAHHRAYSVFDLPLGSLWGSVRLETEQRSI